MNEWVLLLIGVVVGVFLLVLIWLIRKSLHKQNQNIANLNRPVLQEAAGELVGDPTTNAPPPALGALTIEYSDDSLMTGRRFEITKALFTLGRSADNDISFPKDKSVSRHHAEIVYLRGRAYLREVRILDSTGSVQSPIYGTFVNHIALGSTSQLLKTGDEIQLGKSVRLKFTSTSSVDDPEVPTYDGSSSEEEVVVDQEWNKRLSGDSTTDAPPPKKD